MTILYRPCFSSRSDDEFARFVNYETHSFDLLSFDWGRPFKGVIPEGVRLYLGEGVLGEFMMPIVFGTCIFADRAADIIARLAGAAVQFFDAPLYRQSTGKRIGGYKILNATRAIRCLDMEKAEVEYDEENPDRIDIVHKWAFDESLIPPDLHVFRAAEYLPAMFFSKSLEKELITIQPPLKDLGFLEYGGEEVLTILRRSERGV